MRSSDGRLPFGLWQCVLVCAPTPGKSLATYGLDPGLWATVEMCSFTPTTSCGVVPTGLRADERVPVWPSVDGHKLLCWRLVARNIHIGFCSITCHDAMAAEQCSFTGASTATTRPNRLDQKSIRSRGCPCDQCLGSSTAADPSSARQAAAGHACLSSNRYFADRRLKVLRQVPSKSVMLG